jgi:hypothetical protein
MVADPYDNYSFSFWYFACTWLLVRIGALHLFFILIMKISKEQQSVIAITAGLLILGWLNHHYVFLAAAGIMAISFPFSFLNRPIHKGWMAISKILGWISSHVILFILFYLFLVPVSFLRKLFGKQDVMKFFSEKKSSAFYDRSHLYSSNDFINPW